MRTPFYFSIGICPMKIVRRTRVTLATVVGEILLRCNSKIVRGEMNFDHKLCKTKCILLTKGRNLPNTPKPSIGKSRAHSRLSDGSLRKGDRGLRPACSEMI